MNKPDVIRTPDSNNTLVDVNLKVSGSLGVPNGAGFQIEGLQPDAVYIYVKTGVPTDIALQIYFNGNVYQLNQIGPKGDTGAQGVRGNDGTPGIKGDKGDTGAQGSPGIKGDKGDTGAPGAENATLESVCSNSADANKTASTTFNIAAQTFFKISLRSAKRQIKDYAGHALQSISELRVRTYKYKNSDEGQIGFIIDEIKDKSLINNDESAINTDSLLAVAVSAIQELGKRVEALEHERMA